MAAKRKKKAAKPAKENDITGKWWEKIIVTLDSGAIDWVISVQLDVTQTSTMIQSLICDD